MFLYSQTKCADQNQIWEQQWHHRERKWDIIAGETNSKLTKPFPLQCLDLSEEELKGRTVDHLDIAFDEFNAKHYKREEDPKFFKSVKTSKLITILKQEANC